MVEDLSQPEAVIDAIDVDILNAVQWPALVITVIAAWLISSSAKRKRSVGFWLFLLSNVLWVIWGFHTDAYALIALQFCLALTNTHGVFKNQT
jgi:hypothetical protein